MNWKNEAIDKLKQYMAMKMSLQTIPAEIKRLELDMRRIRSATSDGSPVQGGGSGREDMMISNIVQREEMERSLEQAEIWVSLVEGALSMLTKEEKQIIDRFYIYPERGAAERLAGDLRMDVKTIYRRKDDALRKFTLSLYGATES